MHELAKAYNFPLLAFREHERDPGFLHDFLDHLSVKGWLYYDKALDDFYHDRAPNTEPAVTPPTSPTP
jgi:D-alanine transfer protein